jgi:hypothetical protein
MTVSQAMFDEEIRRLEEDLKQRMKEYGDPKTKSAKSAKKTGYPRIGRKKLAQEYLCPCWKFGDKGCPMCNGKGPKIQDPDGRLGELISACPVCRCPCALGKFITTDAIALASSSPAASCSAINAGSTSKLTGEEE